MTVLGYKTIYVLESRCTGKKRAFKTQLECWNEMQGNDEEIEFVEMQALIDEAEAHKKTAGVLQTRIDMLTAHDLTKSAILRFAQLDKPGQDYILAKIDALLEKPQESGDE